MILDHIENSIAYETYSPAFAMAMSFLSAHQDGQIGADRVELSDDVYVMRKSYRTKEEAACHFEAHRAYIDVQFLCHGNEYIHWAPKRKLREQEYLAHKDQYLLDGKGTPVALHPGQFMIFFPEDGHMPCVSMEQSTDVVKLIAKIRVGK